MATITLEVLDRKKAIPLLEAALERQVTHVERGILKTRSELRNLSKNTGARCSG